MFFSEKTVNGGGLGKKKIQSVHIEVPNSAGEERAPEIEVPAVVMSDEVVQEHVQIQGTPSTPSKEIVELRYLTCSTQGIDLARHRDFKVDFKAWYVFISGCDFRLLPREVMGDCSDHGWFHWINHGHMTYFSL